FQLLGTRSLIPPHSPASMSRVFCAALGSALEIGGPSRFRRIRIKITTTKKFTTLMTEWPMFGAAITFPFHASGALGQCAVLRGHHSRPRRARPGEPGRGRSHLHTKSSPQHIYQVRTRPHAWRGCAPDRCE